MNTQTHQTHNGSDCREKNGGGGGNIFATAVCVITFVLLLFFLRAIFWLSAMIWRGTFISGRK